MRPGESYGIRWDDINWRNGAVSVSRSRQYVRGEVVILPTKTRKSNRVLYLPKFAKDRLHTIWITLGKPKGFINPDNPQNIARRIKSFCKHNKLPDVSMTNMRHSWATIAVEAGIAIETVAMFLGHSNIMTHTITTSCRVSPSLSMHNLYGKTTCLIMHLKRLSSKAFYIPDRTNHSC